jgi:hypothetical protein
MANFDLADVDSSCPVRFTTTQPTQSLSLLNSDFTNRQAGIFADFLRKQSPDNLAAQIQLALNRVTQRRVTQEEINRGVELIDQLIKVGISERDALKYFCLVSYNLNEFIYVD